VPFSGYFFSSPELVNSVARLPLTLHPPIVLTLDHVSVTILQTLGICGLTLQVCFLDAAVVSGLSFGADYENQAEVRKFERSVGFESSNQTDK
jgi:hypothetical protein